MGELKSELWKLLKMVTEEPTLRSPLPDWVLRIDKQEQDLFIDQAVEQALQELRQSKLQDQAENSD